MNKKRVIGIGETVFDILFKNNMPITATPGGSTFNSIISLGRAGIACAMITETGDDYIGDITCNYMQKNGVSDKYVYRHEGTKSHVSLAFLDENNDADYIFYKDHAAITLDTALPSFTSDDTVLFGSFFAINPAIRPKVSAMLKEAHNAGAFIYYDINFRKSHIKDLPFVMQNIEENMSLASIVRGSTEDFNYLYGLNDATKFYNKISPLCKNVIVTAGAEAIHVFTPESHNIYNIPPLKTVSTVGAGDNFNAGYLYACVRGMEKEEERIAMAIRFSRDVCVQEGNNISQELAEQLKE